MKELKKGGQHFRCRGTTLFIINLSHANTSHTPAPPNSMLTCCSCTQAEASKKCRPLNIQFGGAGGVRAYFPHRDFHKI